MKLQFLFWAVAGSLLPLSAATLFYRADLTADAVVSGIGEDDPSGVSSATGTALLTLTTGGPSGPTLSFSLEFVGLNVSEVTPRPILDGPDDLVRAIHIHFGAAGSNGGHALNVYGAPREDDADLTVDSSLSLVSGLWDDGDENFGAGSVAGPGDSVALSDALADLHAGELYFQVHTMAFRGGEIRGQILPIPEPSTTLLLFLSAAFLRRRRRVKYTTHNTP